MTAPAAGDHITPPRPLRLLSIPPRHPYVDAVRPAGVTPVDQDRVHGFEPDPAFDPTRLRELADATDLVHLHFGFDHLDGPQVAAWTAALDASGLPLVLTVHDLRNPHHDTREPHDEALTELTRAATALITLTDSAAAEVVARYRRTATVLAHPTLVEPARSADVETEIGSVTVHLKSLRRNLIDPVGIVQAAADGARRGGGHLRVDVHPELSDDPRLRGLAAIATAPHVEVVPHPRFDDVALERYLRRAQVTVLPHRWGTHSGWLELARDLGTTVVAPSCGYYRDQWSEVLTYTNDEISGFDPESLAAAVEEALRRPPPPPADRAGRLAEREAVQSAHDEIYRAAPARQGTR